MIYSVKDLAEVSWFNDVFGKGLVVTKVWFEYVTQGVNDIKLVSQP